MLKTIKLSKNINYLTERLPKPNYSPLRYKSLLGNRSSMDRRSELNSKKKTYDIKLSLPPIYAKNVNPRELVHSDRNIKINRNVSNRKLIKN